MKGVLLVRAVMVVSLFVLFFSGLGQMPMYQRYLVTEIPGLGWTGQYYFTLQLHYIFAAVLIFIYTFQLVSRRRRGIPLFTEQPDRPSGTSSYFKLQRLAQIAVHLNILLLIGSGMIKVIKNLPSVSMPYQLLLTTTTLHNLATAALLVSFAVFFLARGLQHQKSPRSSEDRRSGKNVRAGI